MFYIQFPIINLNSNWCLLLKKSILTLRLINKQLSISRYNQSWGNPSPSSGDRRPIDAWWPILHVNFTQKSGDDFGDNLHDTSSSSQCNEFISPNYSILFSVMFELHVVLCGFNTFLRRLFSQWEQLWHFKLVWMIAHKWFEGSLRLQLTCIVSRKSSIL